MLRNNGRYTRVHKNALRAQLRRGETWEGFIVGDNVNSFHFENGWQLAMPIMLSNVTELERVANAFEAYLERELGRRAAFYTK